ncbi:hypothetical protein CN225_27825 [Sinorhizobium meliloti]|nr:hypothetical protein CN225_27825 [Sinorhizobium meliloti]
MLPLSRKTAGLDRDPRQGSARHPVRHRPKVEIGSGSSDATRPVVAIETWIKFARLQRYVLPPAPGGQGNDRVERTQKREVEAPQIIAEASEQSCTRCVVGSAAHCRGTRSPNLFRVPARSPRAGTHFLCLHLP